MFKKSFKRVWVVLVTRDSIYFTVFFEIMRYVREAVAEGF